MRAWQRLLEMGATETLLASCAFGSVHQKEFERHQHDPGIFEEALRSRSCAYPNSGKIYKAF